MTYELIPFLFENTVSTAKLMFSSREKKEYENGKTIIEVAFDGPIITRQLLQL